MTSIGSGEIVTTSPQPGCLETDSLAQCSTYTFPEGGKREGAIPIIRGHGRSASHGGSASSAFPSSLGSATTGGRPSALKSASRGHQRALSHGQISEAGTIRSGHSRVGSKTDFILPPGHKDTETTNSAPGTIGSGKGHSRQASRSESIYTLRRSAPPSLWRRLWCLVLRRKPVPDELEERKRIVVPNHTVPPETPRKKHPNGRRPNNKVRTTKYTLLSFLPRNLLEQFHRVANLYFIFIVLLNWFPAINAFGKEISMIPVLFVLGVTAVKDLFEDRRRHASDKRINNSTCRIYKREDSRYKKVLWKDVRVGDLIHLSNNELVPADILLLRSSDPNGLCYIDTGHLDGETNLKQRQVARGFVDKQDVFEPNKFKSRIEVDPPTTKIYKFHGTMLHPNGERIPVGTENLLLRECLLKNTDYVEGIVLYAGHETKAMLNNGGPRYKRSKLERQMNLDVIWCVLILIFLCVVGAIGYKLWLIAYENLPEPYILNYNINYDALLTFWTFIIILQIMIPLSLYVTLEMCKLLQVYHIHHNIDLYDPQTDKRIECRALNITEELGQVQYIFSDKTGTLTENKMIFRRCSIAGIEYNHPHLENEQNAKSGGSLNVLVNPQMQEDLQHDLITISGSGYGNTATTTTTNTNNTVNSMRKDYLFNNHHHHHQHHNFTTANYTPRQIHSARIQEFLILLAICNTVVVTHHPHHDMMNASGVILPVPNVFEPPPPSSSSSTKRSRLTKNTIKDIVNINKSKQQQQQPQPKQQLHQQQQQQQQQQQRATNNCVVSIGGTGGGGGGGSTSSSNSSNSTSINNDRYSRLTESRSITPSPPLHDHHNALTTTTVVAAAPVVTTATAATTTTPLNNNNNNNSSSGSHNNDTLNSFSNLNNSYVPSTFSTSLPSSSLLLENELNITTGTTITTLGTGEGGVAVTTATPITTGTVVNSNNNNNNNNSSSNSGGIVITEPVDVDDEDDEEEEESMVKNLRPKLLNIPQRFFPNRKFMNTTPTAAVAAAANSNLTDEQKAKLKRSATPSPCNLEPIFEAESPDELALVGAANSYKCRLQRRTPGLVTVSMPMQGILEYEILQVLPFDSVRKCMSVIVRHPHTNDIILYCKGADSAVLANLAPVEDDSEMKKIINTTQQQLNTYARQGLRVLVMAKKIITPGEYNDWTRKHKECELSCENHDRRIRDSFIAIEKNLTLLGATGIEDRLQDGVPETLQALIEAGIVVWVLTGDKPETAINIAYSAKLFAPDMELLKLMARSKEAAESTIKCYLDEIDQQCNNGGGSNISSTGGGGGGLGDSTNTGYMDVYKTQTQSSSTSSVSQVMPRIQKKSRKRALVVDGKTLTFILDKRSNLTKPFLRLTKFCSSVLCCRATPLQKAYIVRVVKEELKMRTLAIGDGANDVSMIQTADVGIGISGQEGMQAVMAADFALSRFKYLQRFLLVHGHWSYDRLSRMVLYFFYKNAAFVFLLFWYQLYCGFSGAVMVDQMYLMLYNLFFTSLPPLAIGVYDQDAPEDLLLQKPGLYRQGRLGRVYKTYSFWLTMADALYQSIAIFFVIEGAYADSTIDLWAFGTTITTACMFVMLCHVALETRSWTLLHIGAIAFSIGSFYVFSWVYNSICVNCLGLPSTYKVIQHCISDPIYWLVTFLSCVVALVPRLVFKVIKNMLCPDDVTRAMISYRKAQCRGEGFLVSWSRSTSASSIYRATDYGHKNNVLTTIG